MSQGIDPGMSHIRVVEQVVGTVKQSTLLDRTIFLPSPKPFSHFVTLNILLTLFGLFQFWSDFIGLAIHVPLIVRLHCEINKCNIFR